MTYKERIEKCKKLLRRGDMQAIANNSNVSKQTVYNMFNREQQSQLQEAEERAFQAMIVLLSKRSNSLPADERKPFEEVIYGTV